MSKVFQSLVGNRYGDWEVIEHTEASYCICKCICGTIRRVAKKTLLSGASKSCGHKTNLLKDITGEVFGEWTVIEYTGDSKWKCLCSCGNTAIVSGYDLRNGKSTSCGHIGHTELSERNKNTRNILEGRQFGEWTVLEYIGDKKYKCKCSCGKEKIVSSKSLIDGSSKSCGHNNGKSTFVDLTGKSFGDLYVLEYLGNRQYRCRCSCGNEVVVLRGNLLSSETRSCGCKRYTILTKEYLTDTINEMINESGQLPFINEIALKLGRTSGDIARKIRENELGGLINKTFGSSIEKEIFNMFPGAILHDRSTLSGMELDLLYKEHNLAIEINGIYWHSTIYKDMYYHQNKTIECAKKGIRLIHIFEHEWMDDTKRKKLISIIKNIIHRENEVIYARNTVIKQVNKEIAKEFLNKYHLQNYTQSKI